MRPLKRAAAVVVPLGLVVGGVAYGVAHHHRGGDSSVGQCTTDVHGLEVVLTDAQARNASLISAIAVRRGMPAHAATIALAAALQESKLYNLHGGDRDSLGLFQQRHSQGWGTTRQILDPVHATNAFYDALARVPGYDTLPVTVAAQRVQRSGYPTAYAVYENDARVLASALTGYSAAAFSCHLATPTGARPPAAQQATTVRRALAPAFGTVRLSVASGSRLEVSATSRPRGWAIASYLVSRASSLGLRHVRYAGRTWSAGSNAGWQHDASSSAGAVSVD
ncbi:MAG: hypothetical protein WB797_08885 [Nocardioides sp.]